MSPSEKARVLGLTRRHLAHRCDFWWLYAIQAGQEGPVKIGVTKGSPRDRLRTLQTGNHEQLRGLAAWRAYPGDEAALHERFAHARIRGEWFRPVPELLDHVLFEGCTFDDWERE